MVHRSVVLGCGSYLPNQVLTNADLALKVDTSDEWIVQRSVFMNAGSLRRVN